MAAVAGLMTIFSCCACPATAGEELCAPGDLLVGTGHGTLLRFDPSGVRRQVLTAAGGAQTGMCFDRDGNLFATSFGVSRMTRFDRSGRRSEASWGGPFSSQPETCVVDGEGNVYVGEVDGEDRIRKFDGRGRLLAQYPARTERRGIDWVDLSGDQCTLFYTSEGSRVMRYDVCRKRQLDDFASGLDGPCYALRLRANGELLVACEKRVYRFDEDGSLVRDYAFRGESLFAMNLDPKGEEFWTAGHFSGNLYRVEIDSGRGAGEPVFNPFGHVVRPGGGLLRQLLGGLRDQGWIEGLAVCGEPTQAVVAAEDARERASAEGAGAVVPDEQEAAAVLPPAEEAPAQQAPDLAENQAVRVEPTAPAAVETAVVEPTPPVPEVAAVLAFGPPAAAEFGRLARGAEVTKRLDLSSAQVEGTPTLQLTTDLLLDRVVLEIDAGQGWQRLGNRPVLVRGGPQGALSWPLRLRVGECPQATVPGRTYYLRVVAPAPGGEPRSTLIPLRFEVVAEPWLICWGPLLAGFLGLGLLGLVIHGFVSPSRFPPRLGVVLSPEEDLGEGFFHPIRAQRGSGSGFYRDARVFIRPDHRLSGAARGAFVRLRAAGTRVRLSPVGGASLWRQAADGAWESLSSDEVNAPFGVTFRDDLGTLFFEIRNR
jgi:hypothetical protein